MKNIGRCVKDLTQPMTAEITHHAHAIGFDIGLNRMANIPERGPRTHDFNPFEESIMGHSDQAFCFAVQIACHIHAACIAKPPIHDDSHINVQDVPILKGFGAGDAVADYMVHRDAACVFIPTISYSC